MAVDFDKTASEYVQAASEFADMRCANALGECTFSFWVKTTQTTTSSDDWQSPHVSGKEQVGDNDCMWGGITNANKCDMSWDQGVKFRLPSLSDINDGEWHHVAQTMKLTGAVAEIFIDGVSESSRSGGTATAPPNTFARLGMLTTGSTDPYFDGLLDDVRIYNRVITDNEVATLHSQRGGDNVIEGLVSWYKLGDGAPGTTVSTSEDEMDANQITSVNGTPTFEEQTVQARRAA